MIDRREVLKLAAALGSSIALPGALQGAFAGGRKAAFDWTLQAPEAAGMTRAGIETARAAIRRNIDAKVIAGAVTAVARHGKLVMFDAQGWADVDAEKPMRADALFRMASSGKVITAVAVLMMVEEGRLALEDPVSKFIPSFHGQRVAVSPPGNTDPDKVRIEPALRDITIHDLLTHTSGLSTAYDGGPALYAARGSVQRKPGDTLKSTIPRVGSLLLDYQPGTLWRYSPLEGMDVLLYLVELVSGTPADQFLKERLFQPLDMRDTCFEVPAQDKGRLVRVYGVTDGKYVARSWLFPEEGVTYISGAGGLISSGHDMLNFELMLLNRGALNGKRILRPESVALMTRNHVGSLFADWIPPLTGGRGFGLGVSIVEDEARGGGRAVGAYGWRGAYGTDTWADPALDMACVLLIQMESGPMGVADDLGRALRQAIVT